MPRRPRSAKHPREAPAQVLLRGLSVLESINARSVSSVADVASDTGLPKATVVRLLQQLASKGYVVRLPSRRGYQLGERVLALSAGFGNRDAVVEIARAHLARFTTEHKWPVAIATLDVDAMRNRSATLADSPFATDADQRRMQRRVPILASATGLAYLAFCPADERDTILRLLRGSRKKHDIPARDVDALSRQLAAIATAGYAPSPRFAGDPTRGFAVPVTSGGRVLACLAFRYIGRALTEPQAVARFLAPLQDMAQAIADDFALRRR